MAISFERRLISDALPAPSTSTKSASSHSVAKLPRRLAEAWVLSLNRAQWSGRSPGAQNDLAPLPLCALRGQGSCRCLGHAAALACVAWRGRFRAVRSHSSIVRHVLRLERRTSSRDCDRRGRAATITICRRRSRCPAASSSWLASSCLRAMFRIRFPLAPSRRRE